MVIIGGKSQWVRGIICTIVHTHRGHHAPVKKMTKPNDAVVVGEDKDMDDDEDATFLLPIVVIVGGGGGGEEKEDRGGGTTMANEGAAAGASPSAAVSAPLSGPAPLPRRADGDDCARAAACGNAGNGDPLENNNAAAAAVASEADDTGQENDNCSGNDRDKDEDNDTWGRGASFNLSSSLSSSVVGHLVSDAITTAGLLLLGIAVPKIDVQHRSSLRPRRRRTLGGLTKR